MDGGVHRQCIHQKVERRGVELLNDDAALDHELTRSRIEAGKATGDGRDLA
jgi:hypothetical protein